MNSIIGQTPKTISGFRGIFDRKPASFFPGYDSCPEDHLLASQNCIFPAPSMISIREGVTLLNSTTLGSRIISYFYYVVNNGFGQTSAAMYLDDLGRLYDIFTGSLLHTFLGPTLPDDFAAINLFGRVYLCPKFKGYALPNEFVYYWDGTNFSKAAGLGGGAALASLTQVNAGNVDPGVHQLAVSFQSRTGYLSPPTPFAGSSSINSVGGKDIEIAGIGVPVGPTGTVARVFLSTKANGQELFFIPGAIIPNNTVGVGINVNFFDTSLISSADYLNNLATTIPAGSALKFYNGRLIVIGRWDFPDTVMASEILSPETFDLTKDLINIPKDFAVNSANGGAVISDILNIFKPNGTVSVQDNGNFPSTWAVNIVDSGIGSYDTGISSFASGSSSQDVFDSTFICNKAGLYLFTGSYNPIPLTWKIEAIWRTINASYFSQVRITHDSWNKRVYIIAPVFGRTTNLAQYALAMLIMDYQEGLNAQDVKWTSFEFTTLPSFVGKTIGKINMDLISPLFSTGIQYKFSFCIGDNNIYTLDSSATSDMGVSTIFQALTTAPIYYKRGTISMYQMVKYRVAGVGSLENEYLDQDTNVRSGSFPSGFNLSTYPSAGREFEKLINITGEGIIIKLNNTGLDPGTLGYNFSLARIDVYANPMFNMRPALG